MRLSNIFLKAIPAAGLALVVSSFAMAQSSAAPAKTTVSDAQVEASVLKSLAGATDLATQSITTTTVYGVVTLSGSVQTEAQRTEAENLAAHTAGVQKVVDELTLSADASTQPAPAAADANAQGSNPTLQSDGTNAQAPPPPDSTQNQPNIAAGPNYGPGAPEYRQPYNPQQPQANGYPEQGNAQHAPPPPNYSQGYPQQPGYGQQPPPQGYPQQNYPQQGYPRQYPPRRGGYYAAPAYAGQPGRQARRGIVVPGVPGHPVAPGHYDRLDQLE